MKAVNLLPSDLRATERKGPAGAGPSGAPLDALGGGLAVLGLLALLLAGVVATVLVGNSIKGSKRELRTVQAEQAVAQREVDTLAPYGTFQELAAKRLSTVRELASARFDWERVLRDLSRAIPQDVTLDLISGSVSPGANSGAASSNPLRAAISAPAIELSGCTAGQLEVARLMARLRAVQGVSRVSLASSVKESETATAPAPAAGAPAAPAAGTGSDSKRAGCGSGAQPEFEIVVFFEGATAAPAAPAGGAAAAAATPAPGAAATPAPGAPATSAPGAAATPAPGTAAPSAPGAAPTPAPGTQATAQTTPSKETTP